MNMAQEGFPIARIESAMAARGKSLVLGDEEVEDVLALKYGRNRTFAVLAILFPHVNTRNVHHVDHIFPRALLHAKKLKQLGMDSDKIAELQDQRDRLPNLQLLEGLENIDKSATDPESWVLQTYGEAGRSAHLERHAIPWLPSSADQFEDFFVARSETLTSRIRQILGASTVESGEPAEHSPIEAQTTF